MITYVRGYHPTAVFECLWPLDAYQGAPKPSAKFRALNFYVNLPNQWKNSSYGIKYFRCEGFDYDVWQKNSGLMKQAITFASTALGRPASECMFLSGLYGPPDPPMAQAYGMWLPLKLYSFCYWAFDQFCLNSRPVPLEIAGQMQVTGAQYFKPNATRALESVIAEPVGIVAGGAWAVSKAAVINSSGQLDGAAGTATDCVLVNGSSAAKANAAHTHAATDIVSGTLDNARTSGTASATASTLVLRDGSGGAAFGYVAANNQWAYLDSHFQSLESGAYQTVGGPFENMAKYSEDFTAAIWDKNGGSCSVTANAVAAPDGNTTADTITAVTTTPVIQQQIAGLVSGGQYTFYVWSKVASGTKQVSIAIVDNAYAGYLAGPTSITLTTAWQRFKITGTLAGGQTGLWIVVRLFGGNGDNWTSGAIYLSGACLQQGNDPKSGYARTWASQTGFVAAGVACGATVIAAEDNAESPLRIYGPGSNLADHRLLEVTAGGELILAGGTGNDYRFAELMGATNPSGWSGVLKVKTPAGATAGYILLYSNP